MVLPSIPNAINFHDIRDAEQWSSYTTRKLPWRVDFFAEIARQINQCCAKPVTVLELGSGPGILAEWILCNCIVSAYTLLDFSAAMHALSRERLKPFRDRTHSLQRDFRSEDWLRGLGKFDAIVTMQAVHEMRHKEHVPGLLAQIPSLLNDTGYLFYCDHYYDSAAPTKNPELIMTREEHLAALHVAKFRNITLLLDKGGLLLYRATIANSI
jgi:SAM-dependent methyltransferase